MASRLFGQSAARIAELVRSGEASASEVTEATLERVGAADGGIGAYLTVLPELARAHAARVDERVRAGESLPLAGVSLAVKDNMCLEGTRTTCASKILEHWVAPYTAHRGRADDRGGRRADRQNELRRVRHGQLVRELRPRRYAQSLRFDARAGRIERRVCAAALRPMKRRSDWAAIPAGRSANRPRFATSSASSRPTAANLALRSDRLRLEPGSDRSVRAHG